jgi:sarcosine oxidase
VELAVESYRVWEELERETGEQLLVKAGALVLAPRAGAGAVHGKLDFLGQSAASAAAFGIPHAILDVAELRRRFPQFTGVRADDQGYFEPGGGYAFPERCVAVQLERARELGVELRTDETVHAVEPAGELVRVATARGRIEARRAVIAAGAWAGPLMGAPFDRLLTVYRQVLHWFPCDPASHQAGSSPVFIWIHGETADDAFYGFPPLPGERRLKVAAEHYHVATSAETLDRTVAPAEQAAMFAHHVEGRIAGVTAAGVTSAVCMYTFAPAGDFVVDQPPDRPQVLVVSACSGHGFKHSAGLGKAVADQVATGRSGIDLTPFSLANAAARAGA